MLAFGPTAFTGIIVELELVNSLTVRDQAELLSRYLFDIVRVRSQQPDLIFEFRVLLPEIVDFMIELSLLLLHSEIGQNARISENKREKKIDGKETRHREQNKPTAFLAFDYRLPRPIFLPSSITFNTASSPNSSSILRSLLVPTRSSEGDQSDLAGVQCDR
jgi:hypothetical protein